MTSVLLVVLEILWSLCRGEDSAWGEGTGRAGSFVVVIRPRIVLVVRRRSREIITDTSGVGLCRLKSVSL